MTQLELDAILQQLKGLSLTPSDASKVILSLNITGGGPTTPGNGSTVAAPTAAAGCAPAVTTKLPATPSAVVTLATLPNLPVTKVKVDGQARFMKTYKGFDFEVPGEGSDGPFYIITKGYRVGIVDDWGVASSAVVYVSGAAYYRVASLHEGLVRMLKAIDNGVAKVVEKE